MVQSTGRQLVNRALGSFTTISPKPNQKTLLHQSNIRANVYMPKMSGSPVHQRNKNQTQNQRHQSSYLYILIEVLRVVADSVPMNPGLQPAQMRSKRNSRCRPPAPARQHNVVKSVDITHVACFQLRRDLMDGLDVAPRAEGIGASDRNQVRLSSLGLKRKESSEQV